MACGETWAGLLSFVIVDVWATNSLLWGVLCGAGCSVSSLDSIYWVLAVSPTPAEAVRIKNASRGGRVAPCREPLRQGLGWGRGGSCWQEGTAGK